MNRRLLLKTSIGLISSLLLPSKNLFGQDKWYNTLHVNQDIDWYAFNNLDEFYYDEITDLNKSGYLPKDKTNEYVTYQTKSGIEHCIEFDYFIVPTYPCKDENPNKAMKELELAVIKETNRFPKVGLYIITPNRRGCFATIYDVEPRSYKLNGTIYNHKN